MIIRIEQEVYTDNINQSPLKFSMKLTEDDLTEDQVERLNEKIICSIDSSVRPDEVTGNRSKDGQIGIRIEAELLDLIKAHQSRFGGQSKLIREALWYFFGNYSLESQIVDGDE